jgi:hypothetical protein
MTSYHKRNILYDIVQHNSVCIVAIHETKHAEFSSTIFKVISHKLDIWVQLPSVGLSDGIVVGCDSTKVH